MVSHFLFPAPETDSFGTLGKNIFELLQLICFRGMKDVPDVPSSA
ncbi:hypothetical protein AVEN_59164-1, partial [Araneus ventricosus]